MILFLWLACGGTDDPAKPKVVAMPGCVIAPPDSSLNNIAPVPVNTSRNVPPASAAHCLPRLMPVRFATGAFQP